MTILLVTFALLLLVGTPIAVAMIDRGDAQLLAQADGGGHTVAAPGETDVHQHEVRTGQACRRDRVRLGGDGVDHLMALLLEDGFELHRDQSLVLHDQHAQRVGPTVGRAFLVRLRRR